MCNIFLQLKWIRKWVRKIKYQGFLRTLFSSFNTVFESTKSCFYTLHTSENATIVRVPFLNLSTGHNLKNTKGNNSDMLHFDLMSPYLSFAIIILTPLLVLDRKFHWKSKLWTKPEWFHGWIELLMMRSSLRVIEDYSAQRTI